MIRPRRGALPGVSSMDCLVADLGLDPAPSGCQSYEATDFLVRRRTIDTGALLILWQIGFIGAWDYEPVPSLRALPPEFDREMLDRVRRLRS